MTAARRGGKRVGYVRVSSLDQNEQRQLEGIDVDKKFIDKASGKDMNRPQLRLALDYMRDGDVLVIHSMDRLARNLDDLRKIVTELTGRGVVVEFVKESLTFTSDDNAMSKLLLSVMGAFAEFERSLIKERQREGIALAKAAGKYKGGQNKLTDDSAAELRRRALAGENKAALAREHNISRQTLYSYLGEQIATSTDTRKRITSANPSASERKGVIRLHHGGSPSPTRSQRPANAKGTPANPSGKSQGRGKQIPR